jgi:hypothetical protein
MVRSSRVAEQPVSEHAALLLALIATIASKLIERRYRKPESAVSGSQNKLRHRNTDYALR